MNRLRSVNFDLLKSKVVLIVTASVLVLLLVWYFAWMSPEGAKLNTVQQQVTSDTAMVQSLNAELTALQAEKKLVLQELPYLKKVTTAIPPNADQPDIVNQLSTLANDTGCSLGTVSPADTADRERDAGTVHHSRLFHAHRHAQERFPVLERLLQTTAADDNQYPRPRAGRSQSEYLGRGRRTAVHGNCECDGLHDLCNPGGGRRIKVPL